MIECARLVQQVRGRGSGPDGWHSRRRERLHGTIFKGGLVPDERSGGLRQLPRDARAVGGVEERQSPPSRRLQRLPCSAHIRGQVRHQGFERLLSFLGFHYGAVSRRDPHHGAEPAGHRGGLSALSRKYYLTDPSARQQRSLLHTMPCGSRARRSRSLNNGERHA